jgi:hypothetical protein
MKKIKYFLSIVLLLAVVVGCQKENFDDISFVNSATSAAKLGAMFDITQDNTGKVTITPNGEGVVYFNIYYGDATTTPVKVLPGANTQHIYAEGVYPVKIVGFNAVGESTEVTQTLTVSFKAPENLAVTITKDATNTYKINVSATADYETVFKVYYGDAGANEVPVSLLEGASVSHTYAATGTYVVKVVALSGGSATTTYTSNVVIVDPVLLPLTFESTTLVYNISNFDGGAITIVNNPQSNGINTSTKVGKMIKSGGQTWGGSVIRVDENIDFSANKVFRMKVFSPRVGAKVLLKVENSGNSGINFDKEVSTTVANAWEDLVFDYRAIDATKSYNNIVLIFDNGTMGNGTSNFTFLFDDIRLTNQIPTGILALPVTFDLANVNYAVTNFGDNQTVDAVDPTDGSNKVLKTTKPSGAPTWAGTTIGAYFNAAIPFTSTKTQMSIKVYSPAAGIRIRLKVEDHTNNNKSVETDAMTLTANAWETLVFDFANQAAGTAALNLGYNYDMASVFFDYGSAGSGKVFYWDDVTFLSTNVTPEYLALPLNFQSTKINYAFTNFDGGDVTVVNNPSASGINTSSKVGKMVKNGGQTWGGSLIELVNPINFSVNKTFKMKVHSPRVGAKVLLKVEGPNGANFEKQVLTNVANAWEELTFDYSAIPAGSYTKIVLIFDNGTQGDGTANYTFYFDDITLN